MILNAAIVLGTIIDNRKKMFENAFATSACAYSWRVNPCRDGTLSELALDPLPTFCRKMRGSTSKSSGGRKMPNRRIRCWRISRNSFRRITKTLRIGDQAPSLSLVAGSRRCMLVLHQLQVHFFERMGGWFNRTNVCASCHERPHQLRILIIGLSETDGEDALGGSHLLDKRQSADGREPARRVS